MGKHTGILESNGESQIPHLGKMRSPGQVEYTAGKVLEEIEGRRSNKWHRVGRSIYNPTPPYG